MKIGWAEHEIIWLEAALILPQAERLQAYEDIASLTGRTYGAVYRQGYRMLADRRPLIPVYSTPTKADRRAVLIAYARKHAKEAA